MGGLNSFFLLVDEPEVYGLPREPKMPTRNLAPSALLSSLGAVVMTVIGALTLRARRLVRVAAEQVK
jgi:formate dehydrogenase iron-sulfur subunit